MKPEENTQEAFIQKVHAAAPGLTERSIGAARTPAGATSYEAFCAWVEPAEGMSVVDLACGNGPLTELLAQRVGPKGRVAAVDLSEAELAVARERLGNFAAVRYLAENVTGLSVETGGADLVVCHMAFMLFRPLDRAVAEIARVLKSGGSFAAVIPTLRQPAPLFSACARVLQAALVSRCF